METNKTTAATSTNYNLFPILLVNFIGTLGYSIVLPFLVVIVSKLGGNELILRYFKCNFSIFPVNRRPGIIGAWSDRYGRKKILLLSNFRNTHLPDGNRIDAYHRIQLLSVNCYWKKEYRIILITANQIRL